EVTSESEGETGSRRHAFDRRDDRLAHVPDLRDGPVERPRQLVDRRRRPAGLALGPSEVAAGAKAPPFAGHDYHADLVGDRQSLFDGMCAMPTGADWTSVSVWQQEEERRAREMPQPEREVVDGPPPASVSCN